MAVSDIMEKTHAGELSLDELVELCEVEPGIPEAAGMHEAALSLSHQASFGHAFVLAQIGVDDLPCPGNCQYCSFAAVNRRGRGEGRLAVDDVIAYARAYADAGANMVSLMSTDAYGFPEYVELVARVREAVGVGMPIMANTCDFDIDGALQLKAAGATTVYHAYRLGEGRITAIDPARRLATIKAVIDAGMPLSTGIGPVYDVYAPREVAERMLLVRSWSPILAGVCRLTSVSGSTLEGAIAPSHDKARLLNAAFRIAVGTRVRFEYGNVTWLDAGTDPRGHKYALLDRIASDVAAKKAAFERDGWKTCPPALEWFDPAWQPGM